MLVIGHRGAKGLAPENTLESLQAGFDAGADILEFDVRLTADNIPVLSHDGEMFGMRLSRTNLDELQKAGSVTTLESALDTFWGKILLNIEYKPVNGVDAIYKLITKRYIKHGIDWGNFYVASFHVRPLLRLRRLSPDIHLAMLCSVNPFAFATYHRRLQLTAVGWHRLHVNRLAVEIAKKMHIFSYVYTVNRPQTAAIMEQRGIDGVVTDYPDRIFKKL
jgi:glycerophosphoryl diester phosphodiesterase